MTFFDLIPNDAPVGAEVRGLDLRAPLAESVVDALLRAWYDHSVLLFRDQDLTDEQHFAFTAQLGAVEHSPDQLLALARDDVPKDVPVKIGVISNVVENGKPLGQLGNDEVFWHTDSSFAEVPPAASLLRAVEVPNEGGNTAFMNMYKALETLPRDIREAIRGRRVKHDPTYTSAGVRRKEYEEVVDPSTSPGPIHPIERLHPGSGRQALFLGRRLSSYIVGLPVSESEELLDAIWAHITQAPLSWEHRWRVGDLVMWDNRCTMHRRGTLDPKQRRLMRRTQLAGERPE
ncbi:MAG: TauD/TfdA family dioxygenase [Gammaproteobacteria bacterium]|nr:TauD/TfdA family dioxygenase [Gammaproteobacteria bacterium]